MIPYYSRLYALDKKGKLRYFDINISNKTSHYLIETRTGIVNGNGAKPIVTLVSSGKGKRSLEEQAILQANSLYTSKLDEGYKSAQALKDYAAAYDISIEGLDIPQQFEKLKIRYNTDQSWRPLPMLAEQWKKGKKTAIYPGFLQPKLNGVRCIALYDKDENNVVLCTRGGKTFSIPHIEKQLEPWFKVNQNIILDGEIFCKGKRLQEISGAARSAKKESDWLEYHLYDLVHPRLDQTVRLDALSKIVETLVDAYNTTHIHLVPTELVKSEEQVKAWHDLYVEDGYEGAIYRNPIAPYAASFRVDSLLKIKEFIDEEFEIVGCKVDPDKTVGDSFVFELLNNVNDKTFFARPTGTRQEKEFWYSNIEALKGLKATVRYQERTADELPHQGHLRASDSECLTVEEIDPIK